MSVDINPQELSFQRPFTAEVSQILTIKNPNKNPVAFKVKTTAPKQYCVRPNSGRIEPDHEVEVTVLLQAMKQDPAADARCRDKFLVQSVNISGDLEFSNIQQIWDAVGKAGVQEKKIRVSWLPASDGGSASTPLRNSTHLTNGVESTPDVPPPAYSSPSEERSVTDAPAPNIKRERDDDHADFASAGQAASSSRSAPSTAIESVKAAAAGTKEELQAQLAKAQEKIAQLTQEVQSGLRQRKIPGVPDEKAGAPVGEQLATVMRQGSEGVPIKIVAMLCLVSFLLAYFFF